jgi:hypothetical protein
VLEALLVVRQHVGVLAEQLHRLHQQIVEVHRAGLRQAGLVVDVDLGVLAGERVVGLHQRLGGRDQLVLPDADLPVHATRREALGIEPEVADDVAGQALRIGLVVDAERARVADGLGVGAQDANARRVERAHPHRLHHRADQRGHPMLHLVGGLVGERDRKDARRRHTFLDEVRDAMREHAGLARAGAGHHQQRPTAVHDRIELIGVQRRQIQRIDIEQGRLTHGAAILRMHRDPLIVWHQTTSSWNEPQPARALRRRAVRPHGDEAAQWPERCHRGSES